jgi:hypothetical protein
MNVELFFNQLGFKILYELSETEGFRNSKNQFQDQTKGFIIKNNELDFELKLLL